MEKQIPQPGIYLGALASQIVVYETKEGALCAAVHCRLTNSEIPWSGRKTQTMVKQDGTVNTRLLDTMKKLFGDPMDTGNQIYRFEGDDEVALDKIPGAADIVFELVGEHGLYTPKVTEDNPNPIEQTVFQIAWINLPGGGMVMPEPISRKEFVSKHGAKFKALFGGKKVAPSTKTEAKASSKPAEQAELLAKSKLPPPPAKKAVEALACSGEEAYEAFEKTVKGKSPEEIGEGWYDLLDKVLGDGARNRADVSEKEYGQVKAAVS